jgi:WD40 repeat protein/serine/threonine protein kinase
MADSTSCPDLRELQRLSANALSREDAARLARHLAICPRCAETVEHLRESDTLAEQTCARANANGNPAPEPRLDRSTDAPVEGTPTVDLDDAESPVGGGLSSVALATEEIYEFLLPAINGNARVTLGAYRIIRLIGRGATGIVLEGEDLQLGRRVAMKVLKPPLAASAVAVRRFLREARATAALTHDHIVPIYHVGRDRGAPYLVMPLLAGETLEQRMQREGTIAITEVLRIGREVAEGLAAAHEHGLIHRDIKPGNLWLEAGTGRVRILDFGLARLEDEERQLSQAGCTIGTPGYMAPEQARGETAGPPADLFSLGCVLYRLSTGSPPFAGASSHQVLVALQEHTPRSPLGINKELPPAFCELVLQLLAKDPAKRPASAREVIDRIAALEEGSSQPVLRKKSSRQRIALFALIAILLFGAAALVYGVAPGVYRLTTNRGDLVIETNDPDVEVVIKDQTGKIIDRTGKREILLKAGEYEVECRITDSAGEQHFLTRHLQIRRGERLVVDARLEPPNLALNAAEKSLRDLEGRAANPGSDREAVRRDLLALRQQYPGTTVALRAGEFLGWLPSPLDHWSSQAIPTKEHIPVGKRPGPEIVAVLGTGQLKHWHEVQAVIFSPDGQMLASGCADGTIKLWDMKAGAERHTLIGHHGRVHGLAFAPHNSTLVSGGQDGTLRLWDAATGKESRTLIRQRTPITSVALGRNGTLLACGSSDGSVRLLELPLGKEVHAFSGHTGEICSLAFDDTGKWLASAGTDRTIKLRDAASGKTRHTLLGHDDAVRSVAFSPDGKRLASGSSDGTIRMWDPETGQQSRQLVKWRDVQAVVFSRDGLSLAGGSWSLEKAQILDLETGAVRHSFPVGHGCRTIALSPDSKLLAGGGFDGAVSVWDIDSGQERFRPAGHRAKASSLAFSADGLTLASGSWDETVRLWDCRSGHELRQLKGHGRMVASTVFSPDGQILATSAWNGSIRLWQPDTGQRLPDLPGHRDYATSLAFHPSGALLASASRDETVKLWDLGTRSERFTLQGHRGLVRSVACSPDGKSIASGGMDGSIIIWDVSSGKELQRLAAHEGRVVALAYSPDGRALASGGADNTIRLWDAASGKSLRTLRGHISWVTSVSFRGDGRVLASSADDGTVRIWNAGLGTPGAVIPIAGHIGCVEQVVFHSDGRHLATANGNGTIYIVRLAPNP